MKLMKYKDFIVEKTQNSVNENIPKYMKDLGENFMEIDTETIEYGKPLPKDFLNLKPLAQNTLIPYSVQYEHVLYKEILGVRIH